MRLGQLARKLAVKPNEILQFLAAKGVVIEDNSNARIPDENLDAIVARFAPALAEEVAKGIAEEPAVTARIVKEVVVEDVIEEPSEIEPIPQENIVSETNEKPDVIKAPKVELSGLKVIGKIDLPEPKKKETAAGEESAPSNVERRSQPRQVRRPTPQKNPIALKREKEEQEMIRKREADALKQKEQKARHYQKRLTQSAPTKKARILSEEVEEMTEADARPEPKTWFGKFFRWLRT